MRGRVLAGVVCAVLTAVSAAAQTEPPCQLVSMTGGTSYALVPKSGAPFTATLMSTHEQKLADGNTIRAASTARQARDSAGRTMKETTVGCLIGRDGQLRPQLRIEVRDPIAGTISSWTVGERAEKFIHVTHFVAPPYNEALEQQRALQREQAAQELGSRPGFRVENLGTRTIMGVTAEGSRTVRTIAAHSAGNDLSMETLDEVWTAKELSLVVLSISTDPKIGNNRTEVVELEQGEPDPSLFVPPADYTMNAPAINSVNPPAAW
jgi:hypothetical protein